MAQFRTSKLKQNTKTHYYTKYEDAHDHIFELREGGIKAYMTGEGKGIQRGDYLILQENSHAEPYQVDKINYYSNPPDMWVAILKQALLDWEIPPGK